MSLRSAGRRIVRRKSGGFAWRTANDVRPGDVDCTDMTAEEFAQQVKESDDQATKRSRTGPKATP